MVLFQVSGPKFLMFLKSCHELGEAPEGKGDSCLIFFNYFMSLIMVK